MKSIVKDKQIFVVYVFVIILLGLGISYALSNADLSLSLTSAMVRIDEKAYGDTEFDSSNLEMIPILDSEVESKEDNIIKIDFTVGGASTNNNDHIIYDVVLKDLSVNCELLSPYLKWKLVKNGASIAEGSLDYKFDTIDSDGRFLLTTIQQDLPDYDVNQAGYDNYNFYMWISDSCQSDDVSACTNAVDQSDLMGKNLGGKIEVELYTEGKKELLRHPSTNLSGSACVEKYLVRYNTNGGKLSTTDNKYVVPGEKYGELLVPSKTSTVSFDTNGGSNVKNLSNKSNTNEKVDQTIVSKKAKIKFLADEVNKKTVDHIFDGWYLKKNFNTKINSDTVVETDKTVDLYAKWINPQITLPTTSKTGYDFLGWYSDYKLLDLVGKAEDSYEVVGDIALYAKWQGKYYVLTYESNGGSTCSPTTKTITYGEKYGELCVPTKDDYTFAGWYTSLEGGTLVDENTVTEGDATVYARWVANTYTVTLNNQGATSPGTSMIYESYDTKFSLSLDDDAMTTSSNPITIPSKSYTLTYNYNWNGQSDSTVDVNYTFDGYYTTRSGAGVQYISKYGYLTTNASNNYFSANGTLYANWISTSVTLPTPERAGYTFNGWYTSSSGGTKVSSSYTPTANTVLYAQWSAKTYTISFDSNGGSGTMSSISYTFYGDPTTLPENKFTLKNKEFNGWHVKRTDNGYWFGCTDTSSTCVGSNATLGWYPESTATSGNFNYYVPTTGWTWSSQNAPSNFIFYAQWKSITRTITYDSGGGTGSMSSTSFTCGQSGGIPLPVNTFTKTGYTFKAWHMKRLTDNYWHGSTNNSAGDVGWYQQSSIKLYYEPKSTSNSSPWLISSNFCWNMKFYAQWTANTYSIKYNANGGSGTMSNTSCTYNSNCTLRANTFTRSGYQFFGWSKSASGSASYGNSTTVKNLTSVASGTVNLYAIWKPIYTATFNYVLDSNHNLSLLYDNNGKQMQPATKTAQCRYTYPNAACVVKVPTTNFGTNLSGYCNSHSFDLNKLFIVKWGGSTSTITLTKNTKYTVQVYENASYLRQTNGSYTLKVCSKNMHVRSNDVITKALADSQRIGYLNSGSVAVWTSGWRVGTSNHLLWLYGYGAEGHRCKSTGSCSSYSCTDCRVPSGTSSGLFSVRNTYS